MNPTTSDGSQNRLGRSVLAIATGVVLLGAIPLLLVMNGGQPVFAQQGNQTTAGNATGAGNATTTGNATTAGGGNQTQQEGGGGLLGNLTKPFEDLFGGGQ
jgi:hypothetical protein